MQSLKLSICLLLISFSTICIAQTNQSDPIYGLYNEEINLENAPDPNTDSSSFLYQGLLFEHSLPVYGHYDLAFILYDTPNDVNIISSPIIIKDVNVIDGHYKVELDFGSNAFDGNPRWLEIWNKHTGSDDSLYIIGPREKLLPVPYALHANSSTHGSNNENISRNTLDAADGDPVDAVYVDDKGRVGIGTKSPSEILDAFGTVKMSGFKMSNGSSYGYVLTSNESGTGTWQPLPDFSYGLSGSGSINRLSKFIDSTTLGSSSIYESFSGAIGIGTSTPNAKLEVRGGPIKATDGLIIETRTSDPANPVTGQIWLRTDL